MLSSGLECRAGYVVELSWRHCQIENCHTYASGLGAKYRPLFSYSVHVKQIQLGTFNLSRKFDAWNTCVLSQDLQRSCQIVRGSYYLVNCSHCL